MIVKVFQFLVGDPLETKEGHRGGQTGKATTEVSSQSTLIPSPLMIREVS